MLVEEVIYKIKLSKQGKASGSNDIANEFLKFGRKNLAKALTVLFNKIIESQEFQEIWKKSKVSLVYKGKHLDKQCLQDYRLNAL